MSVNKSHSKKAIMTMYVSALCFPAVSMIAGCSGTQSRDPVYPVLQYFMDFLLEKKEPPLLVGHSGVGKLHLHLTGKLDSVIHT